MTLAAVGTLAALPPRTTAVGAGPRVAVVGLRQHQDPAYQSEGPSKTNTPNISHRIDARAELEPIHVALTFEQQEHRRSYLHDIAL